MFQRTNRHTYDYYQQFIFTFIYPWIKYCFIQHMDLYIFQFENSSLISFTFIYIHHNYYNLISNITFFQKKLFLSFSIAHYVPRMFFTEHNFLISILVSRTKTRKNAIHYNLLVSFFPRDKLESRSAISVFTQTKGRE